MSPIELELRQALHDLEAANEALAATRSQEVYDQMIADGQSDLLVNLDNARRRARTLLQDK